MAPPQEVFPASELPVRIMADENGRRRKQDLNLEGGEKVKYSNYRCETEHRPGYSKPFILCTKQDRYFRRFGKLMVEVTALEEGKK